MKNTFLAMLAGAYEAKELGQEWGSKTLLALEAQHTAC
jgi:hypothetical protein